MSSGFEVAVDRQFAARTEECWELLAEIKALEVENRYLNAVAKGLLRTCEADEAELEKLRNENWLLTGETQRLSKQLDLWQERRTLGGPAKPYTPDWSANAKLNGNRPPPYTPKDKS